MATTANNIYLQEVMINACLPSTLVRCIYLFLDLPEEHKTPALIEHVPREHV
uniref:Uncharacterized protein n=1 Tax=Anopheles arabiensis TaxID=7173 RepID=A0A182IHL3_ANOAR